MISFIASSIILARKIDAETEYIEIRQALEAATLDNG